VVLYHCANADCSGGTRYLLGELGAPPPGEDEIVSLELVIGRDSRPYISMGAGGQLQLFACSTSACPEATRITLDATSPALAAPHALGLDADGLPFVLYGVRSDLQVAGCLDASCLDAAAPTAASPLPTSGASPSSSSPTPTGLVRTAVDPAGGINPAVTVGIDGLPVAVYAGTDAVSVMRCGDPRCASGNTIATVPYGGAWGGAVTVGPSGLPVLAALDFSGNLSVVRCNDAGCTDASVTGSLDGIFADFAAVAVVVPEDDRPLVAYQEGTSGNGEIRLARCTDPSCSGWAEAAVDPNPGGSIVNSLELRLGGDGEPVLGYALANGEARIARCSDLDCSGVTVTTAGTKGNDLTTAALGIGSDGTPALAFYSDGSLLVARCGDATCASVTTVRVDEATAGWWTPIGVGFDERDFPIISYWSPDNRHKKLALCNDVACESAELIEVEGSDANGADDQTAVTFLADGSPVYVYHRNGLFAEVCTDPRCGG
jgi:hypothetical protein